MACIPLHMVWDCTKHVTLESEVNSYQRWVTTHWKKFSKFKQSGSFCCFHCLYYIDCGTKFKARAWRSKSLWKCPWKSKHKMSDRKFLTLHPCGKWHHLFHHRHSPFNTVIRRMKSWFLMLLLIQSCVCGLSVISTTTSIWPSERFTLTQKVSRSQEHILWHCSKLNVFSSKQCTYLCL